MNDTLAAIIVGLGVGVIVPALYCRQEMRHAYRQWQRRRSQDGRMCP